MNKFLKYGLWVVAGLVVMAVTGATYIAMTFNPNDYKEQVIRMVKEKQQRTLKLDGDIELMFFPSIGADIGKVSLSEFESDKEFVTIEHMRTSLALLPLLTRKVVVNEVLISGMNVSLVQYKNGKTNIDDLISKDEKKSEGQQVKFDIASVRVENTWLNYRDEASGAEYTLQDLNLRAGRIAMGLPSKVDFSAQIKGSQPRVSIDTKLHATLTFDFEQQLYQLEDMELQTNGALLDISDLRLQASGDVKIQLATREFTAKNLKVAAKGKKGKDNFDTVFDTPALSITNEKFSGEKLTLTTKLDGTLGNIVAALTVNDLSGNAQLFKSREIALELDVKQPEQAFKVKLSSPLSGNYNEQQFNLSQFVIAVNATGDKLPDKSVSSEMKGSMQIDGRRQSVQASMAGGLLQSQVKARVALNNFTNPTIRFDVEADKFDADLYLPKTETASAEQKSATEEQPLDLSALKKLNLDGGLRIGSFKVANAKLSQLRMNVRARDGVATVSPLSANLYQGSMIGSLSLDAQATPAITLSQNMVGINIAPLLKDAAKFDSLEGKGNVVINVSAQGNTVSAMKKALKGSLSMSLKDGSIKGINIAQKLRNAKNMLGKGDTQQTESANTSEKTDFSEMKASFSIINGVAHNEDLSLKSPLLRMTGKGDIDIGNSNINYLAKATLVKSLEGQGGQDDVSGLTLPVRLKGPFAGLKYTLDFGAMVSESAKQKIETRKEEIKTKVEEQLKDKLKGLFK